MKIKIKCKKKKKSVTLDEKNHYTIKVFIVYKFQFHPLWELQYALHLTE